MKTLVYEAFLRCKGHFYSDGFIIVQINNEGKLQNLEGIFTTDYLKSEFLEEGELLRFTIYSKNYKTGKMQTLIVIDSNYEDFELPLFLSAEITEDVIFILEATEKIYPSEKYINRLEMFKKNNVFEKEQS